MRKLYFTAFLLSFIATGLLSGCSKDSTLFQSTSEKIEGEWKYEKVTFRKLLSFDNDNVTDQFSSYILKFNGDNTLIKTDLNSGDELQGKWEIDSEYEYYYDEGQYSQTLNGAIVDKSGNVELLDWEDIAVTKRKLTFIEYKNDGMYKYKLIRQ